MPRAYRSLLLIGGIVAGLTACRQDPTKEPENLPAIPELQITRIPEDSRAAIEAAYGRARQYRGDALLNGELGMQFHANQRYQEAAVMYDRARKIHPEAFRWEYYRGVALSELNDVAEAGASFRRALEISPTEPSALLALAQLYFKSSDAAGTATLEAEGEKTLDLLIEKHPDYVYGLMLRADRLEEAGKLDEAIAIYEAMIAKGHALGLAHDSLARLYEQTGDPDSAKRQAALAEQSPQAMPARQNKWLAAIERIGAANLDHAGRAQMFLQNRMLAQAAEEFELAIVDDPDNAGHRVNLVAVYGMMQQKERAEEHYQAALRLGGADGKVHLNMGTIVLAAGDLAGAEQAYNRALAADGAQAKAHLGLARIALARKDVKKAESYIRQALSLEPLNPIVHEELGRILRVQGRSDEAARVLEEGVAYSEGRTAVRLLREIARLHEEKGDQAAVVNALERARVEAERSESNVDLVLIDAQLSQYKDVANKSAEPRP